jgi:hypothetical protein
MSTLVLILTAAMAVPGNGPKMVSAEMERKLDIQGEWTPSDLLSGIVDDGGGNVRMEYRNGWHLGIWKQEGDRLVICLREPGFGRPIDFQVRNEQELLILHRVKPRK